MWKMGDDGLGTGSQESMEVAASDSPMELPDEELMSIVTPEDLSYQDPSELDDAVEPSLRTAMRLSQDNLAELRQRSTPNILSWVTDQQLFSSIRPNGRISQRRPRSVQDGRRHDPAEYERAVDEIRKIRRQCGM
ncbi:hypothetical protein GE061_011884 [Apolygus lucorum]|uniref:Uncharacterized protein n=1 Tax=Apolygus lucorum TaxID=248454 RepID=A0A8S9XQN7_APOLU|nr:hypothetical protein GE061_011884 [Apolygus lucorum]